VLGLDLLEHLEEGRGADVAGLCAIVEREQEETTTRRVGCGTGRSGSTKRTRDRGELLMVVQGAMRQRTTRPGQSCVENLPTEPSSRDRAACQRRTKQRRRLKLP
jgi:hypothetical protein